MDRELPHQDEIWRHFKNKLYKIIAIAQHTKSDEKLVVYQAMYGSEGIYARPLDMFMSMDLHEIFFTVFGYNQYCESYNLWLG